MIAIGKALGETMTSRLLRGTNTRKIAGFKTAEESVIGDPFHLINPFGQADFRRCHEKKNIGTELRSEAALRWTSRMVVILK